MKKLLAFSLSIVLLLSMLPVFSVSAAESATFSVGSVTGAPGEEVTVALSIDTNPGLTYAQVLVGYDVDVLEPVKIETLTFAGTPTSCGPITLNPLRVTWANCLEDITETGTLANITFKIKDTAAEGTYALEVSADQANIYDTAFNDVPFTCISGSVTVECATVEEPEFDPSTASPAEIVDAAYALSVGEYLESEVTLTGTIIDSEPYSTQYENITLTIEIEGKEDKPIQCYRLTGEGTNALVVGDIITVKGMLYNYNGTIEFAQGSTLISVVKNGGEVPEVPTDPKEIVDAAFELEIDEVLPYEATLAGKVISIDEIYDDNVTLTIEVEGSKGAKNIVCYKLSPSDGEDVFALKVGDIIAVTGIIKNYNGVVEFLSCKFVMFNTNKATFSVGSVTGAPGDEVTVPLSIDTNIGLTYAQVMVGYDANVLEPVKIETLTFAGTPTSCGPITINPLRVTWANCLENTTEAGILANITFKIKDTAAEGTYALTVSADQENVYDVEFNDVPFTCENGLITVYECAHEWEEVVDYKYLATEANCTAKATYYKSCVLCGIAGEETFEVGEFVAHTAAQVVEDKYLATEATCENQATYYTSCSVCGEQLDATFPYGELAEHKYGDWVITKEPTTTEKGSKEKECPVCGDKVVEDIPMLSIDCVTFSVGSVTGAPGDEVTVPLSIDTNLGLTCAQVLVGYDADVLEVVEIETLTFAGTPTSCGPITINPLRVTWANCLENTTETGTLANITFKIKDTAAEGTYALTVSADQENVYDVEFNDVPFTCINGSVTVEAGAVEPPVETSATITFDDKAKRTTFDPTVQQIWEENGITVTNNRGSVSYSIGDFANPVRFYKGTEVIIEYPGMTKLEITAYSAAYAKAWFDSNTDANATVTVSDSVVTITFATAVDSYTVSMSSAQSRVNSITVYTNEFCAHEWVEVVDDKYLATEATCTAKATYYKSCVLCGIAGEETFEAGEILAHTAVQVIEDKYLATEATCENQATYYTSCSVCGAKLDATFPYGELAEHTYGDWVITREPTTTEPGSKEKECPVCGDKVVEDIPMLSIDCVTFSIGSVTGAPGDEVTVPLSIDTNPGLTFAQVKVGYDADVLEPVKIETLTFAGTPTSCGPVTINPLRITWANSLEDTIETGTLANITFKIKDTTAEGTYALTVSADQENVYDVEFNDVPFTCVSGSVTVEAGAVEPPVINGLTFLAGNVSGKVGDLVSVPVSIAGNPGLTFAQVKVGYDASVLEVVNIEKLTFAGKLTSCSPVTYNPIMVTYDNCLEDVYDNGDLANITFRIKDNAPEGTYTLTVSADQENIFDVSFNDVPFTTVNGTITVSYDLGDSCDHVWVENPDEQYLVSEATCTSKAIYHKSCSLCGKAIAISFEYGELLPHRAAQVADDKYLATEATCQNQATYYTSCLVCGKKLDATFPYGGLGEHKYGNWVITKEPTYSEVGSKETECLLCGAKVVEEIPMLSYDFATFSAGSVTGAPGDEVTVAVSIDTNPGLTFAQVKVGYDANALEVVNIEKLKFAGKLTSCSPTTANPLMITYDNCLEDVYDTGDLANITFKIKDTAAEGTYALTVSADQYNIFDVEFNDVPFTTLNGTIVVDNNWCAEHIPVQVADDKYIASEATCEHQATYYTSCSKCGKQLDATFPYGELDEHKYGDWVTTKQPTASEDGIKEKECSVCGDKLTQVMFSKDYAIFTASDAAGYSGDEVTVTLSIVGNPGLTFAQVKLDYDAEVFEIVNIERLTFAGKQTTSSPTTKNPIKVTYDNCLEDVYDIGDLAIITLKIKDEAPIGKYTLTVSADQENIFDVAFNDVPFVCENAVIIVKCPHTETTTHAAVESTCLVQGNEEYKTCNTCGEVVEGSDAKLPFGEHNYGEWYVALKPTFENTGLNQRDCLVCDHFETKEIPVRIPAEFSVSSVKGAVGDVVDVTVSVDSNPGITGVSLWLDYDSNALEIVEFIDAKLGNREVNCSKIEDDPAIIRWIGYNDSYATGVIVTVRFLIKDTAVNDEYALTLSTNQDEVFDIDFDDVKYNLSNGVVAVCHHKVTTTYPAVESTCLVQGNEEYVVCDECGKIVFGSDAKLPLGDCAWDQVVDEKYLANEATCVAKATYYISCTVCGAKKEDTTFESGEVNADNHVGTTTIHSAVESTCTVAGNEEYVTCDDCGVVVEGSDAKLPLAEHTYAEVVDEKYLASEATCVKKATYYASCLVCGAKLDATFVAGEVNADNHAGEKTTHAAVESTCTVAGNAEYVTCDDCGVVVEGSDAKLPLLPHTYDTEYDYTCNVCQYSRAPHAPTLAYKYSGTIVLNAVEGLEYSTDGVVWQESPIFANLDEDRKYTFVQRVKQCSTAQQSEASKAFEVYLKLSQETPDAPLISSFTDTTITLFSIAYGEYSLDGVNWQSSNVFENLKPATEYKLYQRFIETDTHEMSGISACESIKTDKAKQTEKPNAPVVESYTSDSITLVEAFDCEYSMDGKNWQSSNVFSGLLCGTEYTFYQRYKETDVYYAGKASEVLRAKTDKGMQEAPSAPTVLSVTSKTITLNAIEGYEYSRDGVNWQSSNVFTNLAPDTSYLFYQRKAETETHYASERSDRLIAKTLQKTPGDANGDGKINGRDYALILQAINDWNVTIDMEASDVNGDGKVNGRDYALILQFINDWNVELQ